MKKLNYRLVKLTLLRLRYFLSAFFLFVFIVLGATFWLFGKIRQTETEITKLKSLSLVNLDAINHESVMQLSQDAPLLASFLPDKFELFQVSALTDAIAQKTNFSIQSYSLKALDIPTDKLTPQSLNLVGVGTQEQLLAFIQQYKFITGKLVTIDSVNLSGNQRVLSNLAVNVYAYKPTISVRNESIRKLDSTDKYILQQIRKYHLTQKKAELDSGYPPKDNPFN